LQHSAPSETNTKAIHPPPESEKGEANILSIQASFFVSTECLPVCLPEKPLDTSVLRLIGVAKRPTKQLTALVFFGSNIIKAIFSFFFFLSVAQQGGHCRKNKFFLQEGPCANSVKATAAGAIFMSCVARVRTSSPHTCALSTGGEFAAKPMATNR
jgi:hypothetical protein